MRLWVVTTAVYLPSPRPLTAIASSASFLFWDARIFRLLFFPVTFRRLRPIGSKKYSRRSVAGFARKAIQPRVSYHMTFRYAQNGPRLLSISALQKYFLRRHACALKKKTPARAHTHTRPCTQRRPELRRPWLAMERCLRAHGMLPPRRASECAEDGGLPKEPTA
jgi:hypothetical protein